MKIIDNKQGRALCNELNDIIEQNSHIKLSTGFFTVYAFYVLREKLKNIKAVNNLILIS